MMEMPFGGWLMWKWVQRIMY